MLMKKWIDLRNLFLHIVENFLNQIHLKLTWICWCLFDAMW